MRLRATLATTTWLRCRILWRMHRMEHELFFFFRFFCPFFYYPFWLYLFSCITYWLAFVIVTIICPFSKGADVALSPYCHCTWFTRFLGYNFHFLRTFFSSRATALDHTLIMSICLEAVFVRRWRSVDTYWCDDFTSLSCCIYILHFPLSWCPHPGLFNCLYTYTWSFFFFFTLLQRYLFIPLVPVAYSFFKGTLGFSLLDSILYNYLA